MTDRTRRLRPDEVATAALAVAFALSLLVVAAVDDPYVWIGWGVLAVASSGAALAWLNR